MNRRVKGKSSTRALNRNSVVRVSLVGAGAVGSTLAAGLFAAGYRIVSIVSRSAKPALALGKMTRCRRISTSVTDLSPDTEILLLCVPDDRLESVVRAIAKQSELQFKNLIVMHTSGVHSFEILRPLRRFGAIVCAMHPVQSFPKSKSALQRVRSLRGITFGVEGDSTALEAAKAIIRKLGASWIEVPRELKALYHAACVFSSGYTVMLLNAVAEIAERLGLRNRWREVVMPLLTTSVENALRSSPAEALTGPIVRGDLKTVKLHLEALREHTPQLIPLYCVAGIETARISHRHGTLSTEQYAEVLTAMRKFIRTEFNSQPISTKEKA